MELIDQQVINDNKEIYVKIQGELVRAESEILIVTAWFTDDSLFDILVSKLADGVHVEVIVADNLENERLDFSRLVSKGASVYKIKNNGYGGMNQKFCVIDKRIALHGSYNWTLNAKKNNQESIISTNHQETITSLIDNFNDLKNRIANQPAVISATKAEPARSIPVKMPLKAGSDFEHVLDAMIASEVGNFDRKLLRQQGFDRASTNNGDHQVLPNALDSVYSVFINDIDVIDDKKKRLIAKIEEHRVKNIDHLTKTSDLQLDFLQREADLNVAELDTKKTSIEAEIEITQKNVNELKNTKISFIEDKNVAIDQQIKVAEREFLRPKLKWFEFIPTAIFNFALLFYLFLFYSSAAYILLFSVADAKLSQANGIPVAAAQIFNPDALTKAFHRNGTAPLFILLFVFIPLAFAVIDRFVTAIWVQLVSIIFGVILLDCAVAYKVTQAVYEVNYTSGNVNVPWHFNMAFKDPNFYLVFVFGAFGLLLFKLAFKKLMLIFEDRNPDILTQRNQLLIKQLREEITAHTEKIMALKAEAATLEAAIIGLRADIRKLGIELAALPVTLNKELQKVRGQLITDSKTIDEIAGIYTQHILSDNLPISITALKDRINVFLEGWNDFLCQEYAVVRASLKTAQAKEASTAWQNEKFTGNKIDQRVKVN